MEPNTPLQLNAETLSVVENTASPMFNMAVDRLVQVKEGARLIGVSVPTFWRRVADGTIPKPVKIKGSSRWPLSEIAAVIERAKSARHAA